MTSAGNEIAVASQEIRRRWKVVSWRLADADGRAAIRTLRSALKLKGIPTKSRITLPDWCPSEEEVQRRLLQYDPEDRALAYQQMHTVALLVPESQLDVAREFARGFTAAMKIRTDPRAFAEGVIASVEMRSHEPQKKLPKEALVTMPRLKA